MISLTLVAVLDLKYPLKPEISDTKHWHPLFLKKSSLHVNACSSHDVKNTLHKNPQKYKQKYIIISSIIYTLGENFIHHHQSDHKQQN